MLILSFLLSVVLSITNVTITEPVDGETYDGDWLTVRSIVENDNELPDSVHYSLNGEAVIQIPRLNTDWPTYMQNYQNHGYSESPAPMTNAILWTAPVTGPLHEFPNPIVVNGIVYYPSNMGDDKLHALNAATGEELWSYTVGGSDDPPSYSDSRLYHAADSIYCLDALSGDLIWSFGEANGDGSTPCVFQGMVLVGKHVDWVQKISQIYCLDKEDGQLLWDRVLEGAIVSCTAASSGVFYVPTYYGPLYALDALTGDILWTNSTSATGYWDSSPVIIDDKLFIGSDDGSVYCFDTDTGSVIWEFPLPGSTHVTATPAVFENTIIVGSEGVLGVTPGVVSALNMSDGSTIWSIDNSIHGSFGVSDGVVFWGSCTNPYFAIFAAEASTGNIIWEYDPNPGPWGLQSTPSITDGIMYYASTDSNLYAFGTGLKYTYRDDFFADFGANELIVAAYDEGVAVAADTINFTVTGTGMEVEPSFRLNLCANPNPFVHTVSISFELSEPGFTSIEVYDLSGRIVAILENSELSAGGHSIQWNSISQNAGPVSSGLYFCKIESGGVVETTGLCVLK